MPVTKLKLNGTALRVTPVRGNLVLTGFKLDSAARATVGKRLKARAEKKVIETVDGHYNSALDMVKRVTGKGVPVGKSAQISSRLTRKGTGGRTSVHIKLQWAPLNVTYQLRKAREKSPGRGKFWKYTGGLGAAVAAIPDVKSTAAFHYLGKSKIRKGSHEFRFTVKLGRLPEPMQGLMRRSFLEGTPQSSFSGASNVRGTSLGLLHLLEVGGVGTSGWTRPFIAQTAAKMGTAARDRLSKLKI